MSTDTEGSSPSLYSTPKGGLYGGPFDSSSLDPNVRALLMDFRWTTAADGSVAATTISYFFPQQASDYTRVAGYPSGNEIASFQPLTATQQKAVVTAFDLVTSYTGVKFVEATSGLASDASFRFARFTDNGSESRFPANNGKYSPSDSRDAGDTFLGGNGNAPANFFGTDDFNTIMHEMGHAFGLKHGHDASFNGGLAAKVNDNEFSVMTYASYLGSPTGTATEARPGSAPQSYMMYDIAALQALYGANFSKVGTTEVHKWDATTGQETINGVAAPHTGVSETHKIFSTIWTGGATTTYDLSNFSGNQVDDLQPGHWLKFSQGQLADLNSAADAGTPQYMAQGNIYNALLYHGDMRSLVSNIITGSGNDTITGNAANNKIVAGAGNDVIDGGGGNDTITGGPGADTINATRGKVTLLDSVDDMAGDTIFGFHSSDSLDLTGTHLTRADLTISFTSGSADVRVGGTAIDMSGDFSHGDFMVAARGAGEDVHTSIDFVAFLPALAEGARVDSGSINGIANTAFLTGDGSIDFMMDMKSASSAYSNTLGVYKIGADGTIFDVHILYANTLATNPAASAVDLGTPGDGVSIGFFLIQNGFNQFGNLPDNLSFVTQGSGAPPDVDGGQPLVLQSATRGVLANATIFHTEEALNPGHASQVLSGTAPGGHELLIGFEDLPTAKGDNDFQDVVIGVTTTHDGHLLL